MKTCLLIVLFLCCQNVVFGQQNFPVDTTATVSDSTIVKEDPYGMLSMFKGNPGRAALYSLVLPSAGQIYNKRYWKVPLVLGAEAASIYYLIKSINTYREWDDCWKGLANDMVCPGFDASQIATVKDIRDRARTNKDNQWLIFLGVHLIVTADAFIDRHLIEFDVSDDLSIKLSDQSLGLGLVYSF